MRQLHVEWGYFHLILLQNQWTSHTEDKEHDQGFRMTQWSLVSSRPLGSLQRVLGSGQPAWPEKLRAADLGLFFGYRLEEGIPWLHPEAVLAVQVTVSLSYLFQASGPAAPDQGPLFIRTLLPKYLLCPSTLFLPLHDCSSSGPLNQRSLSPWQTNFCSAASVLLQGKLIISLPAQKYNCLCNPHCLQDKC